MNLNNFTNDLVTVFYDTLKHSDPSWCEDTATMIQNTVVYTENDLNKPVSANKRDTLPTVRFISRGTITASYEFADSGRVAMLNFADGLEPGGLVLMGATTQEENICRCTNLYHSLIQDKCKSDYYDYNHNFGTISSDRIIYSPSVAIFKNDRTYATMDKKYADVITCPAPIYRGTHKTALTKNRIEGVIKSAIFNQADTIVLGAWGCGAFYQNPTEVARLFAEVLNEYGSYFTNIIFAIPDKTGRNYITFHNVVSDHYEGEVIEYAV